MNGAFLAWSKHKEELIDTLKKDIDELNRTFGYEITDYVELKCKQPRTILHFVYKDTTVELNSRYSVYAILKVLKDKLKEQEEVFYNATETNYKDIDIDDEDWR